MAALLGLLIASCMMFFVYCMVWASTYLALSDQYISWRKFLKYYHADPDKWCLRNDYVYIISGDCSGIDFVFGPVGMIRYKQWRRKTNKQELYKKLEELFGGNNETSI